MESKSYKTVFVTTKNAAKEWVLIDANGEVLGRLATKVAQMLRGKNKPSFTPNADCGDNVIVINADKVRLTGNKLMSKTYVRHTGYPGGQRFATPAEYFAKAPERVVEKAVRGMLPKSRLGDALMDNLKVYAGNEHPHEAQNPKVVKLSEIK